MMNIKKLCTYIAGLLTAFIPMGTPLAAGFPGIDDPEVMSRVVVQPMKSISMTPPIDTGTLLLSDSPEYAENDGILYGDMVSGDVRLYFYHVNQQPTDRKIVAMLYNPHDYPIDAFLQGYQYTRPSTDYYQVGKELSTLYYEGNMTVNKVTVQPHDYALVGQRLNEVVVHPDQLFSGIINVSLPEPMILSSMILPVKEDPTAFVRKLQYLPSDSVKLRGTFHGKDRFMSTLTPYSTDSGIGYILLADGVMDRFLQGRDVMDNRSSQDTGNYGLDYTIHLRTEGTGDIHLYFNPQGGEYAGVTELIYSGPQRGEDKKIVELPRHRHSMGLNDPYAMEYVDTFPAGTDMTIHIMPPGAANLPVRFLVVPDSKLQPIREAVQSSREAEERRAAEAEARRRAARQDTTIQPEELQSDNQTPFTSLKDRMAKLQQEQKK